MDGVVFLAPVTKATVAQVASVVGAALEALVQADLVGGADPVVGAVQEDSVVGAELAVLAQVDLAELVAGADLPELR